MDILMADDTPTVHPDYKKFGQESFGEGEYNPFMEEIKKLKKQKEEAENDLALLKGINFNSEKQKEIDALTKQKQYLQDQLRKAGNTIKQLTTELGTANDELTVKTLQVDKLERIRKQVLAGLREMKDDLNNNNKDKNGH
jgi:chromosome segregation ATPase